jgi:hypothetical protein
MTMTSADIAAAAAKAVAEASAAAVDRLSGQIAAVSEHWSDTAATLFTKLDSVHACVTTLDKTFAVHQAEEAHCRRRVERLDTEVFGEEGADEKCLKFKVDRLWTVDRVKMWIGRTFAGAGIAAIGTVLAYGAKLWLGW